MLSYVALQIVVQMHQISQTLLMRDVLRPMHFLEAGRAVRKLSNDTTDCTLNRSGVHSCRNHV